jgi:hypothetical protein
MSSIESHSDKIELKEKKYVIDPVIRIARENHKIDMDELDQQNQLQTCCGKSSDKRLLSFLASFVISIGLVSFSCYKLASSEKCTEQNLYVGLISIILGIFVKSPLS